jgi:hypothetical protein
MRLLASASQNFSKKNSFALADFAVQLTRTFI